MERTVLCSELFCDVKIFIGQKFDFNIFCGTRNVPWFTETLLPYWSSRWIFHISWFWDMIFQKFLYQVPPCWEILVLSFRWNCAGLFKVSFPIAPFCSLCFFSKNQFLFENWGKKLLKFLKLVHAKLIFRISFYMMSCFYR